jgi:uncharacterized repeat protein (TIGR01451 family)
MATALLVAINLSGINLWWLSPAAAQTASLYIEPLTWDIIGLDSNNPNIGPNSYLVGARVCNIGTADAANTVVKFVREGATNPYIAITAVGGDRTDTLTLPRLIPGPTPANHHQLAGTPANCFDAYYNAVVDRTSAAYNTTQKYHVEAKADGTSSVRTPMHRQLYVEKILSQGRNEVVSFTGSTNVEVGGVYDFTLVTTTSSAASQLTVSSDFPNAIFQFLDVSTTYSNPSASNSSIYADACGFIADYTDPGYRQSSSSCDGPVPDQYSGGSVGGTVTTKYKIKILSTGSGASSNSLSVNHLILDSTGGSYHYNSDSSSKPFTITVYDPKADLSLDKSHTGNFTSGLNTYNLAVSNNGLDLARGPLVITDALPVGFSFDSVDAASSAGWVCSASGQTVTCTNPNDLAVGATSTLKLKVNVSTGALTNTVNTASVSSATTDISLGNNSDRDPTTVLQGPNISLTKTHSPSTFITGKTGTYTLTVSNPSTLQADGPLVINDTLPAGLNYISSTGTNWTCTANGQNVGCTNPNNLSAGSTSTIAMTVGISPNASTSGVVNTATVSSSSFDANPTDNTATDPTPIALPVPDLTIAKTHAGSFTQGGQNSYAITVTNSAVAGGSNSGDILVEDTLPTGMAYKFGSVLGAGWSCSANCGTATANSTGKVTFKNSASLAPGTSSSFTIIVIPSATGTLVNQVAVSTTGESNTANNSGSDSTAVVATPGANAKIDLTAVKTVTPPATSTSSTVIYSINVTNSTQGTSGADQATFTDTVPSQISFASANVSCTPNLSSGSGGNTPNSCGTLAVSGNSITYPLQLKKNGGTATIKVTGTLQSGFTGSLSNTGTVVQSGASASLVDLNPADNSSTATFIYTAADLVVSKTPSSSSFAKDGTASYIIRATNQGTGVTSGAITVVDTLPSTGVTFVSAASAPGSFGWSCSFTSPIATCTNPNPLAAGAFSEIELQVTPTSIGNLVNQVAVSTPGEIPTANNSASVTTPVIAPNSDLIVTKTGPASIDVGQILTYTLTVKNQGTTTAFATANPIKVTDTLQSGLSFISGTGSGWSCSASGQTATCNSNIDLVPSASSTITLKALVGTETATPINNTGSVSLVGETIATNNTSNTIATATNASADLSIVKSHTGNFVIGQFAAYRLVVANNGPSAIANTQAVAIADTLPNGLTFIPTGSGGDGFTCSVSGQTVACTKPDGLAVGATATLTLNVSVGAGTPTGTDSITNTATISSPVADPINTNNSSSDKTSVSLQQADLGLTKTHVGTLTLGQNATYTLTATNYGPATAIAPLVIADTLPSNLSFVSALGAGWSCTGISIVTCTNTNNLAVGDSTSVDLTVLVGSGTPIGTNSITNTATVASATPEPTSDPHSNTATDAATVVPGADLQITKKHTGPFAIGSSGNYYTLTVKNNGPDTANASVASPIKVIDYLPLGVRFVSATGTDSSFNCISDAVASGNTVTCTRTAATTAASSVEIQLNVDVLNNAIFPLINTAVVGTTLTPDPNSANNTGSDTVPGTIATASPNLLLVKRITAINATDVMGFQDGVNISGSPNDVGNKATDDDSTQPWPTPYTASLRGAISGSTIAGIAIQPGDEVEYTIYMLNNGGAVARSVEICDFVPANQTFIPDAYNSLTQAPGGNLTNRGIAVSYAGNYLGYTNLTDGDTAQYSVPGSVLPGACGAAANTTGAVVVNLGTGATNTLGGTVPNAINPGSPTDSYGFVRFKAKVN